MTDPDVTMAPNPAGELLLSAAGIRRVFRLPRTSVFGGRGERVALGGVDLDVHAGASIGIVGESGSGKTTLARILLGLDRATAGTVAYRGRPVTPGPPASLRWLRGDVQVVFQDPASSLDPRMSAEAIIREPLIGLRVPGDHATRCCVSVVPLPPNSNATRLGTVRVWSAPLSLAATHGIAVAFLSSGY